MSSKRLFLPLLGLVIIVAVLLLNYWLFCEWTQTGYFDWYLKNGALIGVATSVVSLVWGNMRQHSGIVSANPWAYLGSHLQLVGLPIFVLGTHLRREPHDTSRPSFFDAIITVILMTILCIVLLVWLIVVVPLQYFVYLLCGAPARILNKSRRKTIAQFKGHKLEVKQVSGDEKIPAGWWDASIADKPVAITGLFSSLFFLLLRSFLN